ncbi:hypothetical protein TSOC_015349, partial [Tetrabaena socialis]
WPESVFGPSGPIVRCGPAHILPSFIGLGVAATMEPGDAAAAEQMLLSFLEKVATVGSILRPRYRFYLARQKAGWDAACAELKARLGVTGQGAEDLEAIINNAMLVMYPNHHRPADGAPNGCFGGSPCVTTTATSPARGGARSKLPEGDPAAGGGTEYEGLHGVTVPRRYVESKAGSQERGYIKLGDSYAHRLALTAYMGPQHSDDLVAAHLCDNKECV